MDIYWNFWGNQLLMGEKPNSYNVKKKSKTEFLKRSNNKKRQDIRSRKQKG